LELRFHLPDGSLQFSWSRIHGCKRHCLLGVTLGACAFDVKVALQLFADVASTVMRDQSHQHIHDRSAARASE